MMRLITVKKIWKKKNLHVIIIIIKFSLMHAFDPTSKPIYISTAYFATKYVVGSVWIVIVVSFKKQNKLYLPNFQ